MTSDHDEPTMPSNRAPTAHDEAAPPTEPPPSPLPLPGVHQETVDALAHAVDQLLEKRFAALAVISEKIDAFRLELQTHQDREEARQARLDRELTTWIAGQREHGTTIANHTAHLARHDTELLELAKRVTALENADTERPPATKV